MDLEQTRTNMLKQQLRALYVLDENVLNALEAVPRENFVPDKFKSVAFAEIAIPIGHGQTMMLPSEEGRVLQALSVKPKDHVLVVGTGSGYLTALLAKMARDVTSVDSHPDFIEAAKLRLSTLNSNNVIFKTGDASKGWEEGAPYDIIAIDGSMAFLPDAFCQQLSVNGRLFAVLGSAPMMEAIVLTKRANNRWGKKSLFETFRPRLPHAPEEAAFKF